MTRTAKRRQAELENDLELLLPDPGALETWSQFLSDGAGYAACADDAIKDNPAWLNPHASQEDIDRAIEVCNSCPILQQCRRQSKDQRGIFSAHEGVLAGEHHPFVPEIPEQKRAA